MDPVLPPCAVYEASRPGQGPAARQLQWELQLATPPHRVSQSEEGEKKEANEDVVGTTIHPTQSVCMSVPTHRQQRCLSLALCLSLLSTSLTHTASPDILLDPIYPS